MSPVVSQEVFLTHSVQLDHSGDTTQSTLKGDGEGLALLDTVGVHESDEDGEMVEETPEGDTLLDVEADEPKVAVGVSVSLAVGDGEVLRVIDADMKSDIDTVTESVIVWDALLDTVTVSVVDNDTLFEALEVSVVDAEKLLETVTVSVVDTETLLVTETVSVVDKDVLPETDAVAVTVKVLETVVVPDGESEDD